MTDDQKHIEIPAPPPIRLSIGAFQIIVLAAVIGLTWWLTKRFNPTYVQAVNETNTAEMVKLTDTITQLKGTVLEQKELLRVADQKMEGFSRAVSKQNGTITLLAEAVGSIPGKTVGLLPPAPFSLTPEGGFKNVNLVQNRDPALTSVNLSFDPLTPNGLTGDWKLYTEKFSAKFGEFRTEHDGIRVGVQLERSVYDGDKKVGKTEQIPLETGNLYVSQDAIARTVPVPKYTFHMGTSYDQRDGKPSGAFLVSKQFTPNSAVTTGYVNRAWTVLYSVRFKGW